MGSFSKLIKRAVGSTVGAVAGFAVGGPIASLAGAYVGDKMARNGIAKKESGGSRAYQTPSDISSARSQIGRETELSKKRLSESMYRANRARNRGSMFGDSMNSSYGSPKLG